MHFITRVRELPNILDISYLKSYCLCTCECISVEATSDQGRKVGFSDLL